MSLGNPERPVGGIAVHPPAGVELRPLGREDLTAAVGLTRDARGLRALDDLDAVRGRYDALLNSVDTIAFLAVAEGEAAGISVLHLRRRLNFATFEGWLSDLHVRPEAAGRGIEDALLQAAVAEWKLRGGHRVLAPFHRGSASVRDALEAAGFEDAFLDFSLAPVAVPDRRPVEGLSIRPVNASDGQAVTRLIAEFGPQRSPVPERMEAVLRTFAAHLREVEAGVAASVVAELEGAPVGVLTLEWQHPFWTTDLHAWIADLVVTEPMRGRGIGRELMVWALATAADAGTANVSLESGERRLSAHGLYRSLGFSEPGRTWVLRRED
jgi:GNAT superfamily N-acetyltransferase